MGSNSAFTVALPVLELELRLTDPSLACSYTWVRGLRCRAGN